MAMSARRSVVLDALVGSTYHAAALSLVLHSKSPMVPTFRADVRYFELADGVGWFGGGADLTPYYLFDEDAAEVSSISFSLYSTNSHSQFILCNSSTASTRTRVIYIVLSFTHIAKNGVISTSLYQLEASIEESEVFFLMI